MFQDDEYMLVRIRDGAKVIPHLHLFADEEKNQFGISSLPVLAERGENKELATSLYGWLDYETAKRVSFGKI